MDDLMSHIRGSSGRDTTVFDCVPDNSENPPLKLFTYWNNDRLIEGRQSPVRKKFVGGDAFAC